MDADADLGVTADLDVWVHDDVVTEVGRLSRLGVIADHDVVADVGALSDEHAGAYIGVRTNVAISCDAGPVADGRPITRRGAFVQCHVVSDVVVRADYNCGGDVGVGTDGRRRINVGFGWNEGARVNAGIPEIVVVAIQLIGVVYSLAVVYIIRDSITIGIKDPFLIRSRVASGPEWSRNTSLILCDVRTTAIDSAWDHVDRRAAEEQGVRVRRSTVVLDGAEEWVYCR